MKVSFNNSIGGQLAANLELPKTGSIKAYAIFAHCFTCNKNLTAVKNIARSLTAEGIALLRFDFTGLGNSSGDFEDTNFSTNVEDLYSAAQFLSDNYEAPKLLIGHSLGGAAVIFAASNIPSIEAVATIGAPFGPGHIKHMFTGKMNEINSKGEASVNIGGRPFLVKKQFIDDVSNADVSSVFNKLKVALLVLHSPQDRVVEIDNASKIYLNAHHPKSFVSLDGADHLLSDKKDSRYTGQVISAWASRYLSSEINDEPNKSPRKAPVSVSLDGPSFTSEITIGEHSIIADEPLSVGGLNLGPTPFDLLISSLGTCTAMTLRMYLNRKKWDVSKIQVHLKGEKSGDDFVISRALEIEGNLDEDQRSRLEQIADKCPVHKTLLGNILIEPWAIA